MLGEAEQATLLKLARQTLNNLLKGHSAPSADPPGAILGAPGAAFVTLRKGGKLRGCIGFTQAVDPLWRSVREATVRAASADPRFEPLQGSELDDVAVEISVLSPMARTAPDQVKVGSHGLWIQAEGRTGLLLPQVALEWGWDREQLLRAVCEKAGLAPDHWRRPDAELYTFTAQVFGER